MMMLKGSIDDFNWCLSPIFLPLEVLGHCRLRFEEYLSFPYLKVCPGTLVLQVAVVWSWPSLPAQWELQRKQ